MFGHSLVTSFIPYLTLLIITWYSFKGCSAELSMQPSSLFQVSAGQNLSISVKSDTNSSDVFIVCKFSRDHINYELLLNSRSDNIIKGSTRWQERLEVLKMSPVNFIVVINSVESDDLGSFVCREFSDDDDDIMSFISVERCEEPLCQKLSIYIPAKKSVATTHPSASKTTTQGRGIPKSGWIATGIVIVVSVLLITVAVSVCFIVRRFRMKRRYSTGVFNMCYSPNAIHQPLFISDLPISIVRRLV